MYHVEEGKVDDFLGAVLGMVIIIVIVGFALLTIGAVGGSFALEAGGGCDRSKIIHVGGQFPHDVDECTYLANPMR